MTIREILANVFGNMYLVRCVLIASIGFFIVGIDESMIDQNLNYFEDKFNCTWMEVVLCKPLTACCSIFGAIISGIMSDKKGRKITIIFSGILSLLGAVIMYFANSYILMMVSRIPAGLSLGIYLTIIPVYIAELCPVTIRGSLICFVEVLYNIGFLLPNINTSLIISNDLKWLISLGSIAVSSLALIASMLYRPESPWWLVSQGRIVDYVRVLRECERSVDEAYVKLNMMKIIFHIQPGDAREVVNIPENHRADRLVRSELINRTPIRHIFISVLGLNLFQQAPAVGIMLSEFFKDFHNIKGGRSTFFSNCYYIVLLLIKIFALLGPILYLDKHGRRQLLLISLGVLAVSLGLYGWANFTLFNTTKHVIFRSIMTVVWPAFFTVAFSWGLGPVTWVYSSEVFPSRLRAQGVSWGILVNRFSLVILFHVLHPSILYNGKVPYGGILLFYAALLISGFIFCFKFIRETRCEYIEREL